LRHLIIKATKAEVEPSIMMKEVQREDARKQAQTDAPVAAELDH